MKLYTFKNPFIKKNVPFNVFRIGELNDDGKSITYNGIDFYVCDTDAELEQVRKPNITKIIGADTVFCWFRGDNTSACRIQIMREESGAAQTYTRLYIDGSRDYVHDIAVIDNLEAQNLVDNFQAENQ